MKILHICLASFYIDNYTYQENILPKFHKKLGYEVEIIASLFNFDENGEGFFESGKRNYINENKIPVTRLEYKSGFWNKKLRQYNGTYEAVEKASPDIIFIHGCQFLDIKLIVKYLEKNPHVKIYVDNHADFSNSARTWLSKNVLHKIVWKTMAQKIEPYTTMFYGVLPARVDFLRDIYDIPENKTELLVMGADDDKIQQVTSIDSKLTIRKKLNLEEEDFIIVTGGKIDKAKRQVINLMRTIQKIDNTKVKLIVYGSVIPEMKAQVQKLAKDDSIEYIGWINDIQSYELFSIADLVVFPGRHSVYWEQVVAMGTPMVVKYWEGTTHVDIGGNCTFLYEDTEEELLRVLKNIIYNKNTYKKMLKNAQSSKRMNFNYSTIAKKSIDSF